VLVEQPVDPAVEQPVEPPDELPVELRDEPPDGPNTESLRVRL
jgi:hypothetical protein